MNEPIRPPRLTGRLTSLFDPRSAVVTESVNEGGVVLRIEKPRDDEFWADLAIAPESLERWLVAVRSAQQCKAVEDAQREGRRVSAASMPAWTPGRELA